MVLMPMTSPLMLASGPPLLPGLMAASVWMKCWKLALESPGMSRAMRADDAAVTVAWKPNGEPIATDQSPACMSVGVADPRRRQILPVDMNHGQIGIHIGADHRARDIRCGSFMNLL